MGRDLPDVRVHQGWRPRDLNESIAARAFTYRNHIWLGSGEGAGPSFTMAHELAHVMQQTAPGPVGPAGLAPEGASPAAPAIHRLGNPFWLPPEFTLPGADVHLLALADQYRQAQCGGHRARQGRMSAPSPR